MALSSRDSLYTIVHHPEPDGSCEACLGGACFRECTSGGAEAAGWRAAARDKLAWRSACRVCDFGVLFSSTPGRPRDNPKKDESTSLDRLPRTANTRTPTGLVYHRVTASSG